VRHLQPQWPEGLFKTHVKRGELTKLGKPLGLQYRCEIICATLLEDGRFAFLMEREQEDLRTLIDCKMSETDPDCGPFDKENAEDYMYMVVQGMDQLHIMDIVHRDLKASNVLHTKKKGIGDAMLPILSTRWEWSKLDIGELLKFYKLARTRLCIRD
jgi:hypothetical protein